MLKVTVNYCHEFITPCDGFSRLDRADILVGGGGSNGQREYPLQGQDLSVAADGKAATVKHEEIKGFMAAMTMSYQVRDAKEFAGLKPGDLITSTLVIVSNGAYLKDVKRVGEAPLEQAPGATRRLSAVIPAISRLSAFRQDAESDRSPARTATWCMMSASRKRGGSRGSGHHGSAGHRR